MATQPHPPPKPQTPPPAPKPNPSPKPDDSDAAHRASAMRAQRLCGTSATICRLARPTRRRRAMSFAIRALASLAGPAQGPRDRWIRR